MNTQHVAYEIATEIFKHFQLGMGTTNQSVAIAVEEKPQLTEIIKRVIDQYTESQ